MSNIATNVVLGMTTAAVVALGVFVGVTRYQDKKAAEAQEKVRLLQNTCMNLLLQNGSPLFEEEEDLKERYEDLKIARYNLTHPGAVADNFINALNVLKGLLESKEEEIKDGFEKIDLTDLNENQRKLLTWLERAACSKKAGEEVGNLKVDAAKKLTTLLAHESFKDLPEMEVLSKGSPIFSIFATTMGNGGKYDESAKEELGTAIANMEAAKKQFMESVNEIEKEINDKNNARRENIKKHIETCQNKAKELVEILTEFGFGSGK